MEKLTLKVPEAAKVLDLCESRVYELARTQDFPAFKCGGRILISAEGLREWVKRQAEGGLAG